MGEIILNKQELDVWLKAAEHYDQRFGEYDESGNYWSEHVYKKDDKFYSVGFLDDSPIENHGLDGHIIRGEYSLVEVEMIKIITTEWREV